MVTITIDDAIEAMHRGQHIDNNWFIGSRDEREKYNRHNTPDDMRFDVTDPDNIKVFHKKNLIKEPEYATQVVEGLDKWFIPEPYDQLDVVGYVFGLCATEDEEVRVEEELLLYAEKELMNVLRFLIYLVDIARQHEIVLGVGRGSSVASYVLFLIGVHKINSIEYDLDVKEFLR